MRPPPPPSTDLIKAVGKASLEASKVEVPFEVIAPSENALWQASARTGFDVPLGRAGALRLQHMRLGSGVSQHVIVAGKTGSGKSTLLHALIINLALRYDPDEIELYLVDFKQGVEFKTYAAHRLPHARVIAIESDREFAQSVLSRLDGELKSRADQFRAVGAQDLASFRASGGKAPRVLLIVDEFQEFFVEDDRIAQDAALLLDRLVRQGRAFGIHVLLGSQTLAGAYSLARSTLGQMAVRIALQCSEADARLILSEDNSAARLLSRPGEAIYNDSNGLVEGNHPFQVVWLPEARRERYLQRLRALADERGFALEQTVFEGNIPANLRLCPPLVVLAVSGRPTEAPAAPGAVLGEAVAIKPATQAEFARQSGRNLLIVGQNEQAALGMLASSLFSLLAQHPAEGPRSAAVYVIDGSAAGSPAEAMLALLPGIAPGEIRTVARRALSGAIADLTAELERRQSAPEPVGPVFVFIHGAHRLRDLRREEDDFGFSRSEESRKPSPSKQFAALLREGPGHGIHFIAWCDGLNNLQRLWDRQMLREFELRVVLQMSPDDSSALVDTPVASKLGPNRAMLHSDEQGIFEKFRPYAWPDDAQLAELCQRLGQ